MKKDKKLRFAAVLSAVALAGAMTVYAAYDSASDPLVSLSYLGEIFAPQLKAELKEELKAEIASEVEAELSSELYRRIAADYSATIDALQAKVDALTNEYAVVELTAGGRLTADSSCEIVLVDGLATVRCSASNDGLIDCTDGVILYDGQNVPLNHKLLAPENGDGRGITATGDVRLLVRGGYIIG